MRVRLRTLLLLTVAVVLLVAAALALGDRTTGAAPTSSTSVKRTSERPSKPAKGTSGLRVCGSVPAQVQDAVAAVRAGGPYLRPRVDGGTFGNRERLLPARPNGYYREYTVRAPGQDFPGARRLVTGGQARMGAEPEVWFYTADHYESFCELRVG